MSKFKLNTSFVFEGKVIRSNIVQIFSFEAGHVTSTYISNINEKS